MVQSNVTQMIPFNHSKCHLSYFSIAANVAGGDPLKTVKTLFNVRAVSCRDSQFLSQVSSVELEERGLGNRVSLNWLIKKNGPSFSLLPLI